LLAQLAIWALTALGMASVPRSALTAYKPAKLEAFDAASAWPDLGALAESLESPGAREVTLLRIGPTPALRFGPDEDDQVLMETDASGPLAPLSAEAIAERARAVTGETIAPEKVGIIDAPTLEYQKLPLPAWRVEAEKAILFFDPRTGDLLAQTNSAKLFENLVTTIHVMDWTGGAVFRKNVFLTFFAIVFAAATILGVLSVRRIFFHRLKGPLSTRLHQGLGLLLAVQAFLWVSSGLSVVWLLHPSRDAAEALLKPSAEIAWARVLRHPGELVPQTEDRPDRITLTMLQGRPVYQIGWPGTAQRQALYDAETGAPVTLSEADRDAILAERLDPRAARSVTEWTVGAGPKDLNYYFFTGPWPVWTARFSAPEEGRVSIDQTTGHVHTPRTRWEVGLEVYYKVHVLDYTSGIIKYRQKPALLIAIGLLMLLIVSGLVLQLRRMRRASA
jgi:hypothetical protein